MLRTSALTLCASIFTLALPLLMGGCNPSLGSSDGDETGNPDTGNPDTGGDGDGFGLCSSSNPCPAGQFCFNGLCAIGCTSDGDCASNQYCDTEWDMLCKNKVVPTCSSDDDCAASQICVNQYCSTPPPNTSCNPENPFMDGCASDSLCLEDFDTEKSACYSMPPCGENNSCPAGLQGAVCNTDYLPNKDNICLIGLCETASNCPSDWFCVRFAANDPLGICSGGTFGDLCTANSECLSNNCFVAFPGEAGFCQ